MQAPDRSDRIPVIIAFHVGLFAQGEDGRRELCNIICRALNTTDGGNWGRLVKKDRNPWGYPADIIVWKDTREHFDVLTDTGPMWRAHGPMENPQWEWFAVPGDPVPVPVPQPPTPPVTPPTPQPPPPPSSDFERRVAYLEEYCKVNEIDMNQVRDVLTKLDKRKGVVKGSTGRSYGHGHSFEATVEWKEPV